MAFVQGSLFKTPQQEARQKAYEANRESVCAYGRQYRKKLRLEAVAAYGGRCACCGEERPEFLTIDHIHGGGKKHQRESGGTKAILRELKRMGWPKDRFQLLCYNCNCAKGFYGRCPHTDPTMRLAEEKPASKLTEFKLCPRCQQPKLRAKDFSRPLSPWCRPCTAKWQRERRRLRKTGEVLPDVASLGVLKRCPTCELWKVAKDAFHRHKTESCGYQANCIECSKMARRGNMAMCRETDRKRERRHRERLILEYGGRCACCGESNPHFLAIDHLHGNGMAERRLTGITLGKRVAKEGYPKDKYRLLCHNCNCCRGALGYCPHERERPPAV